MPHTLSPQTRGLQARVSSLLYNDLQPSHQASLGASPTLQLERAWDAVSTAAEPECSTRATGMASMKFVAEEGVRDVNVGE